MGGPISFLRNEVVGSTFSHTIPLREARFESEVLSATKSLSSETTIPVPEGKRIPHVHAVGLRAYAQKVKQEIMVPGLMKERRR